jgi:nitroreductase
MGMFMQNVMIIARAFRFETCPQGHIDANAPENSLVTDRVTPHEFSRFHSK